MNSIIVSAIVAMACDLIKAHYNKDIPFSLPDELSDILDEIFHVLEDGEHTGPVTGFASESDHEDTSVLTGGGADAVNPPQLL